MKIAYSMLVSSAVAFAGAVSMASAQGTVGGHKVLSPQEIKWAPAPPSIPPGAEAVVLYGDPGKDEMFAMRLKFPKGYKIAPHTHPKPEVLTVITGTFRLGMGESADPSKTTALPAGSFVALSPGYGAFCIRRRRHGRATQQHRALDPQLRQSSRRSAEEVGHAGDSQFTRRRRGWTFRREHWFAA
jgi:quercetin dioxygenase-like cupin family protein